LTFFAFYSIIIQIVKKEVFYINFHLVHSVKGGCGKSLCALELAMMLNMKNHADIPAGIEPPYKLIDKWKIEEH
jgi:hypothetical protein